MKKFITFVLTAAMAVSALGVTVFADDAAPAETPAATEATEGEEAPADDENAAPAEGDDAEAPAEAEDNDAEAPAEGEDAAVEPTEPEAPAEPAAPAEPETAAPVAAPAAKATAEPSNAKVMVNGEEIAFQAYNIDGNNYFKLRDIAVVLNGTTAGFEVAYDKDQKAIILTKGEAYTGGTEVDAVAATGAKEAALSVQKVVLDGVDAGLTAYNIDGNNFFKLRDLGDALGFEVAWDKEAKTIAVTAEAAAAPEAPADEAATEPTDDAEAPADDTEAPADDAEAPADDTEAPADDAAADDAEAPADDAAADDAE